jgi:diguanylate cyclase (GGDEF)-like protein/PAS domain S-box-containing protein
LINSDGYPLISPESAQIWSFMFPDSPQTNLRTQHPTIWHALNTELRGQDITPEGLFTFDHINPGGKTNEGICKNCLTILLFTPEARIESMLKRQTKSVMPPFAISLLLIGLILGLLLWHWDRRRLQQQEIAALNDQIAFERNLFVSGPGTIVKLRNEIGWPVDYISSNIEALLGYNPDVFLNQGVSYTSIIDPAYLPQYISETEAAEQAHNDTFKRSPYRVLDHQGNRKWVQDVCRAIRDEYGKVSHYYAHISDITALKDAEHRLTLSRDYIQKVVDTLPDPTLVIDVSNYQLQLSNQSARSLYNGGREINPETTCFRLSHKRDTPCTGLDEPCPIHEVMITGRSVSVRHKHYDHNGKLLYIDVRTTPLFDTTGQRVEQIVESHRDVTETVLMEKQLQHMATTDRLTQTFNRLKFDDELKNQIEWAHSTNNDLGLIMFDLDHFKQVNDTYGHDIGDEVLKNTVNLVRQHIRKSDTLARWGGEEFMIITPLTEILELKSISETLRSKIENLQHREVGRITASFGGSVLKQSDTISSLIKRVDAALYQSKQSGRNRSTILE